jgi:hypothetical protein
VRIHARGLGGPAEQVLRPAHQVLVHGVVVGDEHHEGWGAASAGAARLLPDAGERGRGADQHRHVQPADVDPQLQRVGADDAAKLAGEERLLDRPALLGQVTAAVGFEPLVQG